MKAHRWLSVLMIAAVMLTAALNCRTCYADWPTWRYNAARGAASPEQLPAQLHLQWVLQLPAPKPAWPAEQGKMQFDGSYEPVVMGQRMFVPSMVRDCVAAYDTRSGKELWRFYAEGPVRFAPVAYKDNVYFVSDDGHLYCVAAEDGALVWKFNGGPSAKKVLGNDRLVSMWPARGAPVLYDGTIYFVAGIWPFMGTFVHAVDAESGEVVWTNSGSGSNYIVQPHGSPAFAGVSAQGYLACDENLLLVAGGRTVPAGYDRKTGKFLFYQPGSRSFGKESGGYDVLIGDSWYANRGGLFRSSNGDAITRGAIVTVSDESVLQLEGQTLGAFRPQPTITEVIGKDRLGLATKTIECKFEKIWQSSLPSSVKQLHIRTGSHAYGSDSVDTIYGVELPQLDGEQARVTWTGKIRGRVWNMLAADKRLFVVNREGEIFCFGAEAKGLSLAAIVAPPKSSAPRTTAADTGVAKAADEILKLASDKNGYCVLLGLGDGTLADELALRSNLQVIAIDPDAEQCAAARQRLDGAGLLGERVAVFNADLASAALPPYMANLIVCRNPAEFGIESDAAMFADGVFRALRPYGGVAILQTSDAQHAALARWLDQKPVEGAKLQRQSQFTLLSREGSLPGSAPWTHQSADVGNTLISNDNLVKAPLGLLWFGGPSNQDVLPRHGHGPTPQVVGGRLFIEGPDMLRAVDVYTGRLLWQRELKDVGLYYNNTGHHPGAGGIGGNYVSVEDGIYVAYGRQGLRLDPATGKTLATFKLPPDESGDEPVWGYIGVHEDLLIAGSSPMIPFSASRAGDAQDAIFTRYGEGSRRIVVLDRYTGEVLWKRDAAYDFRHNTIAAGGGKLFCLDDMTDARLMYLKRRGLTPEAPSVLYALDARTGDVVWQTNENVFGTWLSYSPKHQLLLQAGSLYRDRAKDEVGRGMAVYRAATGEIVWQSDISYGGPPLLHDDTIITQGDALSLLTGQPKTRKHSLTGSECPWRFTRNYGCNIAIGSTNLLTFRSAAAGYFDLAGDGGTGNLGGFRSSCTSNLVPADGVLNAPDYTRTCSCAYQIQCSLAMVHMPDAEMWTFSPESWTGGRVQQAGINFGAPGDRRGPHGELWLDYPSVGGRSPDLPVVVTGSDVAYYRHHSSRVSGDGLSWVNSSGVTGAETIRITLADKDAKDQRHYTVRLYFADVQPPADTPRTFDVTLQGKPVLQNFNVAESAGGPNQGLVRQFRGVTVRSQLEITMRPSGDANSKQHPTILSGVEVAIEP